VGTGVATRFSRGGTVDRLLPCCGEKFEPKFIDCNFNRVILGWNHPKKNWNCPDSGHDRPDALEIIPRSARHYWRLLAQSPGLTSVRNDRHVISTTVCGSELRQHQELSRGAEHAGDVREKFPVDQEHSSARRRIAAEMEVAPGGDWRMTLEISQRYLRPFKFEGDT